MDRVGRGLFEGRTRTDLTHLLAEVSNAILLKEFASLQQQTTAAALLHSPPPNPSTHLFVSPARSAYPHRLLASSATATYSLSLSSRAPTSTMAEPGVDDDDLFADLYDGDDVDQTAAPAKTDPEPQSTADDDFKPDTESMPVIAGGSSGAADVVDDSAFNNAGHDVEGMEGMQDSGDYHDSRTEDRPIGIKEDGSWA
ncbi:hypothetical protein M409DRAFT_48860 [Zasmidium cellare ATCC 36951]|uniref:Uncharacterized protein n=1 Tax=Zasmidium cellare ATCC 36951 TaxID=1080233 RepID=A0A6A6D3K3_ZASCE|nr:uncharacterized protein M409DRAFT_48860 [Zasmidium cellare ATCC 36951]KAF2173957.1 hypothetical protein M409DRAFT_48860 [Zasmidium cellare ATCC 36951]